MTQASPYTIRDARLSDAAALADLKLVTFRETFLEGGFAIPYPPEDLAVFEAATYGLDKVRAELADAGHHTWVVEDGAGALVAYAHVGPCKLPHPEVSPGDRELYQLYLLRAAQGAGLGKRLLDLALGHITRDGAAAWLGVWSGNDKARHVYEGRGFVVVGEYHFKVGAWNDDERIMRWKAPA